MAKKAVKKTAAAAKSRASASGRAGKTPADKMVVPDATAATPEAPAVQSTYLSADQLAHFRRLLLDKLEEITGDVDHLESGSLKSSRADAAGDLSSMPIHMADIGSDNYEQEFALGLMSSERKIVREILAALKRIENGTYGICEGTGERISLPRLNGIPWARYCVQFAEKLEKGLVTPPSRVPISSDRPVQDEEQESAGGPEEDEI